MKNLLLIIVVFLVSTQVNAQKLTPKFLEGIWETEFHNVEFKVVDKKELKITIILKENNELIDVLSYKIHDEALYMETYYKPNDWKAIGKMIVMDENTLVENVVSPTSDLLMYKRKLTTN